MVKQPRRTIMYCHKYENDRFQDGFWYGDFEPCPGTTALYDDHEKPVLKVLVKESKEEKGSYWGWWDNSEKAFSIVLHDKSLIEICFPYGSKAEEERGNGHLLPVSIEVLEDKVKTAR